MLIQMINSDAWLNGDDDDDEDDDGECLLSREFRAIREQIVIISDEEDEEDDIEECPEDGIKFISHPEECEKYILCIDGDEVATLECPDGFHFSRDLRSCTDPDEAECED
jgi:hypothetical protein